MLRRNPYQNEWKVEGPHLRDYRGRPLKQRWSTLTEVNPTLSASLGEFGGTRKMSTGTPGDMARDQKH